MSITSNTGGSSSGSASTNASANSQNGWTIKDGVMTHPIAGGDCVKYIPLSLKIQGHQLCGTAFELTEKLCGIEQQTTPGEILHLPPQGDIRIGVLQFESASSGDDKPAAPIQLAAGIPIMVQCDNISKCTDALRVMAEIEKTFHDNVLHNVSTTIALLTGARPRINMTQLTNNIRRQLPSNLEIGSFFQDCFMGWRARLDDYQKIAVREHNLSPTREGKVEILIQLRGSHMLNMQLLKQEHVRILRLIKSPTLVREAYAEILRKDLNIHLFELQKWAWIKEPTHNEMFCRKLWLLNMINQVERNEIQKLKMLKHEMNIGNTAERIAMSRYKNSCTDVNTIEFVSNMLNARKNMYIVFKWSIKGCVYNAKLLLQRCNDYARASKNLQEFLSATRDTDIACNKIWDKIVRLATLYKYRDSHMRAMIQAKAPGLMPFLNRPMRLSWDRVDYWRFVFDQERDLMVDFDRWLRLTMGAIRCGMSRRYAISAISRRRWDNLQ